MQCACTYLHVTGMQFVSESHYQLVISESAGKRAGGGQAGMHMHVHVCYVLALCHGYQGEMHWRYNRTPWQACGHSLGLSLPFNYADITIPVGEILKFKCLTRSTSPCLHSQQVKWQSSSLKQRLMSQHLENLHQSTLPLKLWKVTSRQQVRWSS